MFRNAEGRFFQDVTTAGGFGHLQKGHGIAFADIDNDGDQDIFANMGGAYSGDVYREALFENSGSCNRWLKLQLVGTRSNRAAIGARIKVSVKTKAGPRRLNKTVNSGGSFGANPLRQEIGLGEAESIRHVEIFWPVTVRTQTVTGLRINATYRIKEGNPEPELIRLTRLKLKGRPGHADHAHQHD
jgi:hypothetical protein